MPKGNGLVAGMVLFGVGVTALVAWLIFGGVAGKQRGLVFKNFTQAPVVLRFDDGRTTDLQPGQEQTLPVKPAQFPQTFTVTDASGKTLYERVFAFSEFKAFEFRIGIGPDGFETQEMPATN